MTLRGSHLPEYAIEAVLLGLFMIAAGVVAVALEAPASPLRAAIESHDARRALAGLAMGATAVALIHSPLGRRSGAHMNPAVTLTFFRLGKVSRRDLCGYAGAQAIGGTLGVVAVALLFGMAFREPPVSWVQTRPGPGGAPLAFAGEVAISFAQMSIVLAATSHARVAPWTGWLAGAGVATWIALEAPLSGMSMNPARSLASALPAGDLSGLWIYFAAPVLGMLAAAQLFLWVRGLRAVACAKLIHDPRTRCIFCGHEPAPEGA